MYWVLDTHRHSKTPMCIIRCAIRHAHRNSKIAPHMNLAVSFSGRIKFWRRELDLFRMHESIVGPKIKPGSGFPYSIHLRRKLFEIEGQRPRKTSPTSRISRVSRVLNLRLVEVVSSSFYQITLTWLLQKGRVKCSRMGCPFTPFVPIHSPSQAPQPCSASSKSNG